MFQGPIPESFRRIKDDETASMPHIQPIIVDRGLNQLRVRFKTAGLQGSR